MKKSVLILADFFVDPVPQRALHPGYVREIMFFILSFFIGDLFLQNLSALPEKKVVVLGLLLSLILWLRLRKIFKLSYLLPAFAFGFAYSAWFAYSVFSWSLPTVLEGQTLEVTGSIASLPIIKKDKASFIMELQSLDERAIASGARIHLTWRKPTKQIHVGDRWRFRVRLKRIHSTQSPGAFDFEAWALQNKLRARGYILAHHDNQRIGHHWYHLPIEQIRQHLRDRINKVLPNSKTSSFLLALTLGEHANITKSGWEVLRNTGTNHLIAIAGLHIGIIAAFNYWFVSQLWRRIPKLVLKMPAQQAGKIAGLIMAIFYSALAGFSLPTQRACIMLLSYVFCQCRRHQTNPWHPLFLSLFLVLLLNPASILSESFWLSFGTITLIIYGLHGRLGPHNLWWRWGRIQWVLGLGLAPLTILLFQQCSLISFIANSIAVPWMSFTILPFCFLGTMFVLISPQLAVFLYAIADYNLSWMWFILTTLSQFNWSVWHFSFVYASVAVSVFFGFWLCLLPSGFPGRVLGFLFLLPLLYTDYPRPEAGDFWMAALDVGQGLAVAIQTKHHVLIYDAGAEYENVSMGESIVAPYLYSHGIHKINTLVVSHADNDHSGGAKILIQLFNVKKILTGTPQKLQRIMPHTFLQTCVRGDQWIWDGVHFSVIHPLQSQLDLDNDSSCVLRIETANNSLLLTGDIEKPAIKSILRHEGNALATTVLVAPHHGSKSSFNKDFILLTHPSINLFATGYRNQYHFPHPQVAAGFNESGTQNINIMETGTILMKFKKALRIPTMEYYRERNKHYWYS